MEPMPQPAHAKPAARDHLWVLVVIAAACGLEVCATWTSIGARSGFPVIRLPFGVARIPTDFCLMVCMEAYAGYALFIWLARARGRRSGPFAMWSGIGAVILSLTGQVAYHVTNAEALPPRWLVGFVSALPVVALLLVAILVHLVRLDREDAATAERDAIAERERLAAEAMASDERTALRAELGALTGELETARAGRENAHRELSEALTRADRLAAKLDALSAKKGGQNPRKDKNGTAHAGDLTTEFRAFEILRDNPELRAPRKGAELGRELGASAATGRRLHARLIVDGQLVEPLTEPLTERSADQSDERS